MTARQNTLPKDFEELILEGDISKLKAVFEKCDANAVDGYSKGNALCFRGISTEFIRWLVEQGTEVNQLDHSGCPPVYYQAQDENSNLDLLLELGADIDIRDHFNCTPLFHAAMNHNVPAVLALVRRGANVNIKDHYQNMTPLDCSLSTCANLHIPRMAAIADILLSAGASITPVTKEKVQKIGRTFEFYRPGFNREFLPQTEEALVHLYQLFNVDPVPQRKLYDGTSPIMVKSTTWQKQFNELWDLLVPGSGSASTLQGEVIRIAGKLSYEILENGGANWDNEYKKLSLALADYLNKGNQLESHLKKEARNLAKGIARKSDENSLDRLCELIVKWVLINPTPIALSKVAYKR